MCAVRRQWYDAGPPGPGRAGDGATSAKGMSSMAPVVSTCGLAGSQFAVVTLMRNHHQAPFWPMIPNQPSARDTVPGSQLPFPKTVHIIAQGLPDQCPERRSFRCPVRNP